VDHRDLAAAHGKRRAVNRLNPQEIECDTRTRDVEDRIERTDFVKVNLFDRRTVHARFGLAQALVDAPCLRFLMTREIARIDERENLVEMPTVACDAIAFDCEIDVCRGDVSLRDSRAFERPRTDGNRPECGFHGGAVDAGIEQRTQDHISTRATDRLEIRDFHAEVRV
jgi:hypothetical protein